MKAIELAKKRYPNMSEKQILESLCPDTLLISERSKCQKERYTEICNCESCWQIDVSEIRPDCYANKLLK